MATNNKITTRLATLRDSRLIWRWRNEPRTRLMSLNSEPVSWDDHQSWIKSVLKNMHVILLMVQQKSLAIGIVRFDEYETSKKFLVNINLNPSERSKGLSKGILFSAITYVFHMKDYSDYLLSAQIKNSNLSSVHLFKSLGFTKTETQNNITTFECKFNKIIKSHH